MPGVRTAAQLVRQVREHAQEISTNTYRDGFSDDPNTGANLISILSFVNQALTIFSQSGFVQSDFAIPTTAGTREYTIPQVAGKIIRYKYIVGGVETNLRDVTISDLDRRVRNWPSDPNGLPRLVVAEGQYLILYPTPSATGSLTLRATAMENDLAVRTDTPAVLPARYHDALSMLGGMLLCGSDADNPARQARIQELMVLWQGQDADLVKLIDARAVLGTVARPGG